jgi:hypothetical protein
MRRRFSLGAVFFLLLLAGAVAVQAQLTTAMLSGIVKDQAGAVIAGAEVVATNTATNYSRSAKTNEQGEYRIEFLPVGPYQVEVTAQGFSKSVQKGIVLEVNQSARVDAVLAPGTVREVVEVTSAAALVNTNNAEIGQTIENVQIQELPLVNRNVYTLLDITPGVQQNSATQNDGAGTTSIGYPDAKVLINGGSDGNYTGTVNYFLDGGINMTGVRNSGNVLPNPDAILEFRVQTNAYSAEYGRFANGVINVVTKSGTNQYHGSVFEFWRNDILNATPWTYQSKGGLHRNQFGTTIGGPIRKDKTFFFASYAGLRQVTPFSLGGADGAVVPTDLQRKGDFTQTKTSSGAQQNIIDPATGKTITCNGIANVICPDRMDPVAVKILQQIPMANMPGNRWQGFIPVPYNTNDVLAKIDHALTTKHQLSGTFFTTAGSNLLNGGSSNVPWSRQLYSWRQVNLNVSDTATIGSMVNQIWAVYTRMFGGRLNIPGTSLADYGSKFLPQGTPSLPDISISGFFRLGNAIAGPAAGTNLYSVRDVLSAAKGRHNLKFGGEMSLEKDLQQTLLNNYGVFTFDNTPYTKYAFANFLLGLPSKITQDSPVSPATSTWGYATYVQDDFRAFSRLTINMGLRWDIQTSPVDSADRLSTFVPGQQSTVMPSAPIGLVFPGDKRIPRGIMPMRWGHISPRIGLAYDPFGDGKTSIRAAAGIFWASLSGNEWNQSSNFQPFATRLTFTNTSKPFVNGQPAGATLSDPYLNYPGGAPFPYKGQFNNGGSLLGVAKNFDLPYTYQLNASIQRQITNSTQAAVAYVGSITHDLPFTVDINYPTPGGTTANIQARRPNQAFGAINQTYSNQNSWYHALQVTATKRMSNNFSAVGSYVYSKTLCTAQVQGNSYGVAQNMSKLWEDRGRCDTDIRQMANLALVFKADYYRGQSKLLSHLLNGWQVSPILKLRSGSPFSVMNGTDANADGNSNDRANLVPGVSTDTPHVWNANGAIQWFNPAAFVQNTAIGTDGNSPRNFMTGPGSKVVDLALSRTVSFTERYRLQFRCEATNALNTVNWNNPTASNASSSSLGQITGAKPMRNMQLGLKLLF